MSVYLITGSSRGLGRAIAEAAVAGGHDVLATARRREQLDDLAGDRLVAVGLDVTDYDAATRAVQTAVERFGASTSSSTTPARPTSHPSRTPLSTPSAHRSTQTSSAWST
jgi:NAD(P)-dependent dehydrogenase (short-subunit alcohol dehydrogenase family)